MRVWDVTVRLEVDANAADVKEYVQEALDTWGGQRHPDDPFFHMYGRVKLGRVRRADRPAKLKPMKDVF